MARKNLQASLVAKAESLRSEEERQANAAVSYVEASQRAKASQAVAAAHATAVEQALDILTKAGVTL